MPFIGTTPAQGFVSSVNKQSFTANGSTTSFTPAHPVSNANDLEVFVGNVRQEPTAAYSASGTTLDFGSGNAPPNGVNLYVVYKGLAQVTTTPPDGSVGTGKIAANAITAAKLHGDVSLGKTLGITKFSSNTRTSLSQADIYDFFNTNITQVKANSKFLVHVHLIGFIDSAGAINFDLIYDGTTHTGEATYAYTAQDYCHTITGIYYIDGSSSAGSKNFKFRHDLRSNTGRPFAVWNPNHNDDNRMQQTVSNIIFIEYDF